jgi:hypothetical protein
LQCPVPQRPRTSFGSLSQDEYSRELPFQFDCDFAIGRDYAHLLDQAADDLESLTAVVRIADGCLKSFDLGAVDCRQIGMQERLVFGCLSKRARQSLLLGFQLFELGIDRFGVGALEYRGDQALDLALYPLDRAPNTGFAADAVDRCLLTSAMNSRANSSNRDGSMRRVLRPRRIAYIVAPDGVMVSARRPITGSRAGETIDPILCIACPTGAALHEAG